jgi:CheY-like chemotaxis protein
VDGRQVAEKIKAASPETAVIMLTGWGTMLDKNTEKQTSKVDALVSKPPRLEELNRTLVRAVATVRRNQGFLGETPTPSSPAKTLTEYVSAMLM